MTDPTEKLLNVHEVLSEAKAETDKDNEKWATQTFRLPEKLKELTDQICKANGTTTSEYLRRCCHQLVADYVFPKQD